MVMTALSYQWGLLTLTSEHVTSSRILTSIGLLTIDTRSEQKLCYLTGVVLILTTVDNSAKPNKPTTDYTTATTTTTLCIECSSVAYITTL